MSQKDSAEKAARDIRRKTRRKFSAKEKIRIVLEGLRGGSCTVARVSERQGGIPQRDSNPLARKRKHPK